MPETRGGDESRAEPASASARATSWRWLALLLAIGLLAGFARRDALDVGLLADDYMHHAMLTGSYPGEGYAPLDLYAFLRSDPASQAEHVARGTAPWWSVIEGDPDADRGTIVFSVLRPLSSALLSLDHRIAPLGQPGAVRARHLHSLLWFVLAIVAAGLVLGELFEPRLALLAAVLFACDAGLVIPLAWLANRCVLISASFGLLGVWAHLRRRAGPGHRRQQQKLLGLEIACMSLAVAAGEYGLVAAAYALAWELVGVPGSTPARERARALLPAAVPVLIYLALHRALGYGVYGEAYTDMFSAPGRWLVLAAERLPKLATSAAWAVPAATAELGNVGMPWLTGVDELAQRQHLRIGASLLALLAAVVWIVRPGLSKSERRVLRALVLGALLGLAPVTAAPAQARLLVLAQLGACALLAATIVASIRLALGRLPDDRDPSERVGWLRRLIALPVTAYLLHAHTVVDLGWGRHTIATIHAQDRPGRAALARGDLPAIGAEGLRDRDVVVLNAVDLSTGLHGGFMLEANGWPAPRSWRAMAMGPFALAVARPSPTTLELWTIHGAWLGTTYEHNFRRADQPLEAGTRLERGELRFEVLADLDGHPTRVLIEFPDPVDDPRYLYLISTRQGLRRWRPPAVGGHGIVPLPVLPVVRPGEPVVLSGPDRADAKTL